MQNFVKFNAIRALFLAAAVILIAVFLGNSLIKLTVRRQALSAQLKEIEKEVEALKKENLELLGRIDEASAPSFLEKEARRRLNLKKPGEKMVIIVPSRETQEHENIETQEQKRGASLWQKIIRIFVTSNQ